MSNDLSACKICYSIVKGSIVSMVVPKSFIFTVNIFGDEIKACFKFAYLL